MTNKIKSALISVFYKDGLEPLLKTLQKNNVVIYSTGGTKTFIDTLGIECVSVETVTEFPSVLGGRVKTLHPKIFGGILGRRNVPQDVEEMQQFGMPEIDLVIVDLYPFEETVATTTEEKLIIEKIDIGGPSMIRAAAKNHEHTVVIGSMNEYENLNTILMAQAGETNLDQRKHFAMRAFQVVAQYDVAIANWFLNKPNNNAIIPMLNGTETVMRYGENPHQQASFFGNLNEVFTQVHGKELSYNNLVDVDGAMQLMQEFTAPTFAIIKHTNTCGVASKTNLLEAWHAALSADPESAFGGVLICNGVITEAIAQAIDEIFFEVLIAQNFDANALDILQKKKNRILLINIKHVATKVIIKNVLNGMLVQDADNVMQNKWEEVSSRNCTAQETSDLQFANIVCKHLKSNAIAIVKNNQLIGKGCGQTSRVDALRYAIEKAAQFNFDLKDAVLASDAFFPFDDCVKLAHTAGVTAFVQPGGSIRDADSITYCKENNLAMVLTGARHFKH